MKNNKKIRLYLIITAIAVAVVTVGLTAAYFAANITNDGGADVTVTLSDKASIDFNKGDDLIVDATMSNFVQGNGNQSDSTTASATLTATGNYTGTYNMYFEITNNDFVYTTDDETAELILTIYNETTEEYVTTVEGLDNATVDGITGFDITEASGLFQILDQYSISVNTNGSTTPDSTTQNWTYTLYFINLDSNQNENAGKTFNSDILLTVDEYEGVVLLKNQILIDNSFDETGEEKTLADSISLIENKEEPDFSETATSDDGIYTTLDNDGPSYYFRGATEDNYVLFAGIMWRIVRIDGLGNIRLIMYNEDETATSYGMLDNTNYAFNENYDDASYVDYRISDAKETVDTWYSETLEEDYQGYLVKTDYCMDMTGDEDGYGAALRLDISDPTPTLTCEEGNYESYYAGLITADEMAFAGAVLWEENSDFYLYSGFDYWSGSPFNFIDVAGVFNLNSIGGLGYEVVNVYINYGLLPGVSLSSSTQFKGGEGSMEKPYIIE